MSATTDKAEEKENKARMERKVLVDDALFLEKRSFKSLEMSCDHNGRFFKIVFVIVVFSRRCQPQQQPCS